MKRTILGILTVASLLVTVSSAQAYTIHGKYAILESCERSWSELRTETGYSGTYNVSGEHWTVYFGSAYCSY